jgi:hypothetical protein
MAINILATAQSKKEQIILLNSNIDSINAVLEAERKLNSEKINALKNSLIHLETKIEDLTFELGEKIDSLKILKSEIENLRNLSEPKSNSSNNPNDKYDDFFDTDNFEVDSRYTPNGLDRIRLNNPDLSGIKVPNSASLTFKLFIDKEGNVVEINSLRPTNDDVKIIAQVQETIKRQVKYNKISDDIIEYVYLKVKLEPK